MVALVNQTAVPLSTLLSNIERVKTNPTNVQRAALQHLSDVSNGLIDIVDPTNPFIYLLGVAAVMTSASVNENNINTRRQYARLAQTEDDLYMHMSDNDFLNRFATPSSTIFSILIQMNSLDSNMIDSPLEKCYKITIPRNTMFSINGLNFSIQYPIDIRKFYSGITQISYDTTALSPIQALDTNIIDFSIRTDSNFVKWIYFEVSVQQFNIISTQVPVIPSAYTNRDIQITDNFYYCRVFYQNDVSLNKWVEIITTHTDQVFDPLKPTALIKVIGKNVNVSIPQIYINSNLISGNIRIDIYETLGNINVNMSNYLLNSFTTSLLAVDDINDVSDYTIAMNNVVCTSYSNRVVNGGTNGINFTALRDNVVYNGLKNTTVPITNSQLTSTADTLGFSVIKNVDAVTNRIFLATKYLPPPMDAELITPSSTALDTLISDFASLKLQTGVRDNGNRITITPETLFINSNGIIGVYPGEQVNIIKNATPADQAAIVSKSNFLFTPLYYVLDNTTNEFVSRAYHLDSPVADALNFISQNPTTMLQVNTAGYGLVRVPTGYKLTIITKSDDVYKSLADSNIRVQLAFIPTGEVDYAYMNGTLLSTTQTGERFFEFIIDTNWDIDSNNDLVLNNFAMFNSLIVGLKTGLKTNFTILYTTDAVPVDYKVDTSMNKVGAWLLPNNSVVITEESISMTFGENLANLWTSCRSVANIATYETYAQDVPMTYDTDVFAIDPLTNSIFSFGAPATAGGPATIIYNTLHYAGSPVLDLSGLPVYKHRAGDVVLDSYGVPVPSANSSVLRYVDILFMEGVYYFSNSSVYTNYVKEITKTIVSWINTDIAALQKKLIGQTNIYYYAKRAIGQVKILDHNDITYMIESRQTFSVSYYVNKNIYDDLAMRATIENRTIAILDSSVKQKTVSISDIIATLKNEFGSTLVSIKITGLAGARELPAVTVVNDEDGLSLNKVLVALEDGSLIVKEDVKVDFYLHGIK